MEVKIRRFTRGLYSWEIEEFRSVFGNRLDYLRVRIHEGVSWPDWADRIGRKIKGLPAPGPMDHNAITLGNHCFFPVNLPNQPLPVDDAMSYQLDWLVHELTHCWQYQHMGWNYLIKALNAQFRDKERAYDYGGEKGLLKSREKGQLFKDFNPEQQGNITQAYYYRSRHGMNVDAWAPYIKELNAE